jgi:hypothetical protein
MNRKGLLKFLLIVAIGIVLVILGAAWFVNYQFGPSISVQGLSSLDVKPNKVSIYVTVESRNVTAEAAEKRNSEITAVLVDELKKLGLDEEEIQLSNYNIYPWQEWENGKTKYLGYIANRQIIVETGNFSKVSGIVDRTVSSGALVSNINFELSSAKQNEYKVQALEEASNDAKTKASAIAVGQGKKLGRLVSIESQEFNYYPYRYFEAASVDVAAEGLMAQKAAVNLAPKDLEITALMQVQYKLSLF